MPRPTSRQTFPRPCDIMLTALGACACLLAQPARAILQMTGTGGRNLTAPTGALADSGWQYEGYFGGVLATPIAPNFFLTAKHAGFAPDGQFHAVDGSNYTVIASFGDPNSDIAIYETAETFTNYAPIYTGSDELTLGNAVLYGCGTQRGDPVLVNGVPQGWTWGTSDFARSWGTDAISSIVNYGPSLGDLLIFSIEDDANSCAISSWDSGGGIFVNDNGTWKLAGMNYGTETYSTDGASGFFASLWDTRGLYVLGDNGFDYVDPSLPDPQPGLFAGTRLSSRNDFIESIIGADLPQISAPEPGDLSLLLCAAVASGFVKRRRMRR